MTRNLFALPLLILLLGGCGFTPYGDFARGAVTEYGAQAMDEGLVNAEFFVCRAASVGSVVRRYGKSAETAEAWKTLCLSSADVDLFGAPAEEPAEE